MVTEADYRRAQHEEGFRQTFLDMIDLEKSRPYVRHLLYVGKQKGTPLGQTVVMETNPPLLSRLYVRGIRSSISVYPSAFSPIYIETLDDFLIRRQEIHRFDKVHNKR